MIKISFFPQLWLEFLSGSGSSGLPNEDWFSLGEKCDFLRQRSVLLGDGEIFSLQKGVIGEDGQLGFYCSQRGVIIPCCGVPSLIIEFFACVSICRYIFDLANPHVKPYLCSLCMLILHPCYLVVTFNGLNFLVNIGFPWVQQHLIISFQ